MDQAGALIQHDEPAPVRVATPSGAAPYLILCDHAGRLVPRALGDLGVAAAEMDRHIAWDIGAEAVSLRLGALLDAVVILQRYSRLVIDCNRPPGHATSIPDHSDGTAVPGNAGLDPAAAAARVAQIVTPYHAAIAAELDRRRALGGACVVIAVHSFTPSFAGVARPWEAGVLYDCDPGFSLAVGAALRAEGLVVGDNEPYRLDPATDYTVPVHAQARGLPYLELEIRQDLIASPAGQERWATLLADVLPRAWAKTRG
ncbi:MAG: N-formylglutamate amidohydrolase [Acetobacteraceae bacterium]